jgi:alpha-beta hydrolase superfamily lysophospholipase
MKAAPTAPQGVYISTGEHRIAAMYDAAAGPADKPAVLICAPWGWEETASYRPRRAAARKFVEAGHPVLRFDLPAVGDSSGTPADPGLVSAWVAAIADAAAWLRNASARNRVAAFGLGIGGTLALAALERGAAIDELMLWATPARGRRFVREIESFAKLQSWEVGRGDEAGLPDGWTEAGGFVISAETATDLKALAPLAEVPARLRRALLLDRDGIDVDSGLREKLEAAVEVTVGDGAGWGKMVSHPEHSVLPAATIDGVIAWLGESDGDAAAASPAPAIGAEEIRLDVGGVAIRESTLRVPHEGGSSFAVVCEPEGESVAGDVCVVFLNAGAVRHIGPNRNWVENARRWAARGLRSVRIDLDGIGEAGGERPLYLGVGGFYAPEYGGAVRAVLDEVAARGLGERFVCIGLCSGGYWALQLADHDERVERSVLLNVGALVWHVGLSARRDMQSSVVGSLGSRRSWKKLLRFEVDLLPKVRIIRRAITWRIAQTARSIHHLVGGSGPRRYDREIEAIFDRLYAAEKPIAMAFSGKEPVLDELRESGLLERFQQWPNIDLGTLVGEDHALAPIPAQASGRAVIDREIERFLALDGERAEVTPVASLAAAGSRPVAR